MGRACFLRVPVSEANDLNYLLCTDFFLFIKCDSKNIRLDWKAAHIVIHEVCTSGELNGSGNKLYITPVDSDVGSDANDNKQIGSRCSIDE
jgi:hypothetical protein